MQQITVSGLPSGQTWVGRDVAYDLDGVLERLRDITRPVYVVQDGARVGVARGGQLHAGPVADALAVIAHSPPINPAQLGDATFQRDHGVRYSYTAGAMAGGIASEELVIALGKAGVLASFGAAGLVPARVEQAIQRIKAGLPDGPYAFNLIHSPGEPALERGAVEAYLKHGVTTIEASAFLDLTPHVVRYRAAGLSRNADGSVHIGHRVIAKLSRREVAAQFMQPAPERLLKPLVEQGLITAEQAELAQQVPMADDVTCEADSGGHTDNRPLVALLPSIIALRDEIQAQYNYPTAVRVGAGGGIGTPSAALATFMMGAAYIVTGSINQAAMEAGSSMHTKKALSQADMADVAMAPAADMFEMGVKVQVLKRGTMYPMRAQKLYDLYAEYDSIEAIPEKERQRLEKSVLRRPIDDIWQGTIDYFNERDPEVIARAEDNPKRKMALIFRWYLGLSSRWSNTGEAGREMDYQIWCGPAMGAFNAWVQGTYMEDFNNRHVADIAEQIMQGAAYLYRMQTLQMDGVHFPAALLQFVPQQG
jgi:trans-AT polyketide synthase, acyltransferase and oxidoreductase domains